MARASHWARLRRVREEMPAPLPRVVGVLCRIVAPPEPNKIAGLFFRAMEGKPHPLDGQIILFEPPIWLNEVPAPWDELTKYSESN